MGTRYRGSRRETRALDAFIKMMRAAGTVEARLQAHLKRAGLTTTQLGVLEMLLHLGPLRQHEIGERLLVSRANVTLVVDQLAKRGWVRREQDSMDRRCMVVHLTAAGRRKIERVFPEHSANIAQAFSPLTAAEQEELGRLCRKLGLGT
jgi:MarR family 2-MHQ and catechol resistance regulon transcriptional repressor